MESLDGIVNAVTEIILVFEEAQSDFTKTVVMEHKNLDNLMGAINEMIEDERKVAKQIQAAHLRSQMEDAINQISGASNRLGNIIRKGGIANEEFKDKNLLTIPRTIFEPLHGELRVILQNMVKQLQITDQVNVDIMLHSAKLNLECVARMKNCDTLSGLVAVAREATNYGLEFQMHIKARTAETTDPVLRQRIVDAAETVRTGQPVAVECCKNEIEAPSADNKAKKEKALKTLVQGMQEIVSVICESAKYISEFSLMFDLPPPTDTYQRTPRVEQALARLENAIKRGDENDALAATKDLVTEVGKQVVQGKEIASKMKNAEKRDALLRDLEELEKLTAKIVAATKKALQNLNDEAAKRELQDLIDQARAVNQRINDAKKPEKEFLDNTQKLESAFSKLLAAARRGDVDEAVKAAKDMADQIKKQVELGRAFAADVKDPARKKAILDACDELEKLAPLILHALKKVLANPNDAQALKELEDLVAQARAANSRLNQAIMEEQLARNNELIKSQLGALQDQVKAGDAAGATETLKDLNDTIDRRIELGRKLANEVTDPQLKKQILDACNTLEKKLPELVSASRDALQNPKDRAAMDHFNNVVKDISNAADRVTASKKFPAGDTADEVIDQADTLARAFERLAAAVRRGDVEGALKAAQEAAEQMRRQVELGRKLAAQCQDPELKKTILAACDKLESLIAPIVEATKDAVMNPGDKQKQDKLARLLKEAQDANNVIADAARKMKANKNLTSTMGKMTVSEPYKGKDEIMAAAYAVGEAARASAPINAEHKNLLDIASAIAKEMELLSQAAKNKNKKDMIEISRRIAGMIGQIQSFSGAICAKCTDPILRDQLQNICRVPKNFSVQLKIIAAVKATSGDNDSSAEAQLVTCAQGLANSVISTVKAAEAASLKCPKA